MLYVSNANGEAHTITKSYCSKQKGGTIIAARRTVPTLPASLLCHKQAREKAIAVPPDSECTKRASFHQTHSLRKSFSPSDSVARPRNHPPHPQKWGKTLIRCVAKPQSLNATLRISWEDTNRCAHFLSCVDVSIVVLQDEGFAIVHVMTLYV